MANEISVIPVILCGGSGARLWPLSRASFPKQFFNLSNDLAQKSLFQQAISRINQISNSTIKLGATLIVANEEHRHLILDQLEIFNGIKSTLLLESSARNSAPALTLAALQANFMGDDPILVVTPSDQAIKNEPAYIEALQKCISLINSDNEKKTFCILGVSPISPEVGYGYIKCSTSIGEFGEYSVKKFIEKPDVKSAQNFLDEGNYFWNSGIFVLRASVWLSALEELCPEILSSTLAAWQEREQDQLGGVAFIRPDKDLFNEVPSNSIDYAVIEKFSSSRYLVKMLKLDAGWSDLGTWNSVWQAGIKDKYCNVVSGDVLLNDSKNLLINANSRLVSAVGVENLIIIETADAVMVANRLKGQEIKEIVFQLEAQGREEKNFHRQVSRPWGFYDNLDEGKHFKVKRIHVKPGASLSLQMHRHRAEHWVVVKGTAEVTIGDQVIVLKENQSTYIPQGQIHRLANPSSEVLELIEVQSGSYLGEDDIVRLDDAYGRK